MRVNRYKPHIFVLPEDDANSQVANGFCLDPYVATQNIQILNVAGGWQSVIDQFLANHVADMQRYPDRYVILVIDFDDDPSRLSEVKAKIPVTLRDRVFVIGTKTEPEQLKPDLGAFEDIGLGIARDCRTGTAHVWGHVLLQDNAGELVRMRQALMQILFA